VKTAGVIPIKLQKDYTRKKSVIIDMITIMVINFPATIFGTKVIEGTHILSFFTPPTGLLFSKHTLQRV